MEQDRPQGVEAESADREAPAANEGPTRRQRTEHNRSNDSVYGSVVEDSDAENEEGAPGPSKRAIVSLEEPTDIKLTAATADDTVRDDASDYGSVLQDSDIEEEDALLERARDLAARAIAAGLVVSDESDDAASPHEASADDTALSAQPAAEATPRKAAHSRDDASDYGSIVEDSEEEPEAESTVVAEGGSVPDQAAKVPAGPPTTAPIDEHPYSEESHRATDLDRALSAKMVADMDDEHERESEEKESDSFEAGAPLASRSSHALSDPSATHDEADTGTKRESIDNLKSWIRQTSTKLKSFRRESFRHAEGSKAAVPTAAPASTPSRVDPSTQAPASTRGESFCNARSVKPTSEGTSRPEIFLRPNADGYIPASKVIVPYDELVARNLAKDYDGLVQAYLETHLSNEDFRSVFGKSRGEFYALPRWRQVDHKKRVQLF